jgi:M6 family metalloprotease-like protein
MNRIIISTFLLINIIYGINPPQNGNFPDGFWEKMRQQDIGQKYGDPGWVKKISNYINDPSRDTQLEFFVPVLLGKYADVSTTYFNASDYDQLLFGENPTGSMKDYYNEISYGNFLVDGTSGGWYESTLTMAQAVSNAKEYVAGIAALADDDFDYAAYDNDGPDNEPNSGDDDGYVDGILVVYSGCGAEWGSGNDNLWPHMSSLGAYEYETNDIGFNGSNIIVSSYAVNPELAGGGDCYTDIIRPMGVYAHEFGHILGLPDLYDRDDSDGNSEGLGEWCLMASGSWMGWAGDRPAHMSSWCKIQMGWIEPTVLDNSTTAIEIPQLVTSPFALKVWEDDYHWSRYFLIENRQAVGFDSELHGPGLIVYHVDENRGWGVNGWSFGSVNDDEQNKLVDLEEADGDNHLDNEINRGDNGDPFPGTSGNRTFDDNSNPSATRNDGYETGISFSNISDPDSVMTVDIENRSKYGYAIAYDENGIAPSTFPYNAVDKWSGVLFTAEESGYITEIDFGVVHSDWWDDDVMDYVVSVYDSFDGTSPGDLMDSVSGSTYISDWITVSIDSVAVVSGQDFFVSIKFINETYAFCYDNTGQFSERSYLSGDGVNYDNLLSYYGDANIRAKVSSDAFVGVEPFAAVPNEIMLFPNYPNPFNPETTFSFNIGSLQHTSLRIYDIQGRLIETLVQDKINPGFHTMSWDASEVATGVYFVKLISGDKIKTRKIMVLK